MLRCADALRTYDVQFEVAGTLVKMKMKSLSLEQRSQLLSDIAELETAGTMIPNVFKELDRVIVSIEGYDENPSEVLGMLEHKSDLLTIFTHTVKWLSLDEQMSKNFNSSSEQATQEPAGSAEKPVEADDETASTTQPTTEP